MRFKLAGRASGWTTSEGLAKNTMWGRFMEIQRGQQRERAYCALCSAERACKLMVAQATARWGMSL